MTAPSPQPETKHEPPALPSLIGRLAHDIERTLSPGDVAALRRMAPREPACPAYWKLLATLPEHQLPAGGDARDAAEWRWAVVLATLAELKGLHAPWRPLGQALGETVSEQRFLKLIRSHDDGLFGAVRLTARTLSVRGESVDCTAFALLVFSDGRTDEDKVRRRLARDFYSSARSSTSP